MSRIDWKASFTQELFFYSKSICGQLKCSFDRPTKFFGGRPKTCRSSSEMDSKTVLSQKNIFLLYIHVDKLNAVLTTRSKSFQENAGKILLIVRSWKKIHFVKKNLSWKCSYGHVECSCNNPARKFPSAGQKFFADCPTKKIQTSFKKTLFPENVLLTRKIDFWQPLRKFSDGMTKIVRSMSKND